MTDENKEIEEQDKQLKEVSDTVFFIPVIVIASIAGLVILIGLILFVRGVWRGDIDLNALLIEEAKSKKYQPYPPGYYPYDPGYRPGYRPRSRSRPSRLF